MFLTYCFWKLHTDVFLGKGRQLRCDQVNQSPLEEVEKPPCSDLPNDFYFYNKSEQFLLLQNEVESLQIGEAITNWRRFTAIRGSHHKYGQISQICEQYTS